jgi:polyketide synthase PksN
MNQQDDEVRLLRRDNISTDNEIPVPATPIDRSNEDETRRERRSSDIAIIGLSGRFAGSANLEAFWDHLQEGHSCIEEIKRKGWEASTHSGPDSGRSYTSQVEWGGMLQNIDQFDPLFFNISPLEAAKMDPQQRLFLEDAYKAFEDAGYSAEQLSAKKVGVFVGARSSDYKEQALRGNVGQIDAHLFLGNDMAILAARISYFLNLKGPSLTIDTASSSSLVAIHLACESIHTGESEMALAGGVFVMSSPEYALMAAKTQMLSPDGKCKTFDKSANGIVLGEGVGALVLKPLDAAIEDGDHIYGVLLGSAMNQDGKTFGMTAPSLLSQKDLLVSLYKKAAVHPETVSYIEAHGTGSKLGDPIEV